MQDHQPRPAVGTQFGAYFDHANKTIGLSEKYVAKLTPALKDKDALLDIITVLAHEKRHATHLRQRRQRQDVRAEG